MRKGHVQTLEDEWMAEAVARAAIAQRAAVNDLHVLCLGARAMADFYSSRGLTGPEDIAAEAGWGAPLSEADATTAPAGTIEEAGILGLYRVLASTGCTSFRYGNDLARIVHGIDAIGWMPGPELLIGESKGTTRPVGRSAASYLRATVHKGRQLSPEWCWRSFWPMACHMHTARTFLDGVRRMVDGRYVRLLSVIRVTRTAAGYVPCGEHAVWLEADLSVVLGRPSVMPELARWLREIDGASPGLVP